MPDHPTRRDVLRSIAGLSALPFLGVGSGGALGEEGPATAPDRPAGEETPWYRRYLVGIEWGPTGANDRDRVYMSRAHGGEIIRNLVKARAEYAVVFMKDMKFAYYNSRVARKAPGLADRDLLRECLAEATKHGMPVVAYCQIQYDTSSWDAHPEWRMKDSGASEIGGRLCYRSGYLEFIQQVAAEMMEYEIAGFHFDMLDFGFGPPYGCWCDVCRREFREEHGIDMPPGVTWDDAWDKMFQFRADSNTRFCRKLQAFVKSKRPDVAVDFNYHGSTPFSWETGQRPVQHAANGDFVTAEGLPFVLGHYNPSLLALFMKAARPDGLVQGVTSRSVYDYHDFTVRPTADLKWEVFCYLSHNAQCTIVDKANYDGTSDPLVYERLGSIFAEARQKRAYFGHPPIQEVGLYFSSRTREWFAREDSVKYYRAFWGAHKALTQAHVTMGLIMDESVSLERLRQFPVVYLAGVAILSAQEVDLLEQYVSGGGNLLVTGLTGLYDQRGALQKQAALQPLTGGRVAGCQLDYPDNYVRLPASLADGGAAWLLEGIRPDWPMLTWGPIVLWEATTAEAFGELLVAHRTEDNPWSHRMSADRVVGPAVLVNRHGKGTVITVGCSPDAAYADNYRMPEHRRLLSNLVRRLHPEPEVSVEAPPNVEIVVTQDQARPRLLVHLLSFFGPPTAAEVAFANGRRVLPPLMEEELPYRARVRVKRPLANVRTSEPSATLSVEGQTIELTTDRCHTVLEIDLSGSA